MDFRKILSKSPQRGQSLRRKGRAVRGAAQATAQRDRGPRQTAVPDRQRSPHANSNARLTSRADILHEEVSGRRHEQEGVDPIEQPAVAGEDRARCQAEQGLSTRMGQSVRAKAGGAGEQRWGAGDSGHGGWCGRGAELVRESRGGKLSPGKEVARVLDVGGPLEQRYGEVTDQAHDGTPRHARWRPGCMGGSLGRMRWLSRYMGWRPGWMGWQPGWMGW